MDEQQSGTVFEEQPEQREFIAAWHRQNKQIERLGGIGLIFAGALIIAWENPMDPLLAQIAVLVAALLLAGGITLIFGSRRPAKSRIGLRFLDGEKQRRRSTMAGLAAAFMLFRGIQMARPLFTVLALVLAGVAVWLSWRAHKIAQFDALARQDVLSADEIEA